MGEFLLFFLGTLPFIGFFGAALTRGEAFPGNEHSQGKYPETLFFWVIGISGGIALFLTLKY